MKKCDEHRCEWCGRFVSMDNYVVVCIGSITGLEPEYNVICQKCHKKEQSSE